MPRAPVLVQAGAFVCQAGFEGSKGHVAAMTREHSGQGAYLWRTVIGTWATAGLRRGEQESRVSVRRLRGPS